MKPLFDVFGNNKRLKNIAPQIMGAQVTGRPDVKQRT